jgi:Calcium-binding EGF domain
MIPTYLPPQSGALAKARQAAQRPQLGDLGRIRSLGLVGALAAAFGCGDSAKDSAAQPQPGGSQRAQEVLAQVGYWNGETNQGNHVGFRVSDDGKVTDLTLVIAVDSPDGTCVGPFSAAVDATIKDEAFAITADFPAGLAADIKGTFTDTDRAKGTFAYAGDEELACGGMLPPGSFSRAGHGTWRAAWSAESLPAIMPPAACSHAEDGICDEPEGTGLCAQDTDAVDCKALEPPPPTPCQANAGVCDDEPDACVDNGVDFICMCPAGFAGNGLGVAGCIDINECTSNTHACIASATCINTIGSYFCVCMAGLHGSGLGDAGCVDNDGCVPGADCDAGD